MAPSAQVRTTQGRGRLFDNVLDTIGDTPCIRINTLGPQGVTLYAKAEAFNPGGSVKDRLAVNIIEAAERNGTLKPGQTVTPDEIRAFARERMAAYKYPRVVEIMDELPKTTSGKIMRSHTAPASSTARASSAARSCGYDTSAISACTGSAVACAVGCNRRRMILPLVVFGSSSMISTTRGYL